MLKVFRSSLSAKLIRCMSTYSSKEKHRIILDDWDDFHNSCDNIFNNITGTYMEKYPNVISNKKIINIYRQQLFLIRDIIDTKKWDKSVLDPTTKLPIFNPIFIEINNKNYFETHERYVLLMSVLFGNNVIINETCKKLTDKKYYDIVKNQQKIKDINKLKNEHNEKIDMYLNKCKLNISKKVFL